MAQIKKACGAIEYNIEFSADGPFDFEVAKNNGHFKARTNDIEEFNRITGWVAKHNGKIIDIKTAETSLEEIFLKLMSQA
ncbi:hypothetical protein [Candidatus Methanoperedens nitratireducens]|uniref:Uncharacterized protein n=1 Tax=Candidatus Methanoperedens nitratireducens TaxID=1392998 RepID=A0A284VQV0_9EURY|nr:hypothetical protein [Candidatus Methanoperedens nitroreducens]SNQ61652.1 hypothetical protein MNV_440001 [Candidatus Methanoperedens nitroreducens]